MFLIVANIFFNILFGGGSPFESELDKYMQQNFSSLGVVEYTVTDDIQNFSEVKINYKREPNRIGNTFFLPVTVKDYYGLEKERFISIKLKIYREVLVAAAKISKGEPINFGNSRFEEVDITELNFSPITKEEFEEGYISKYDLRPNTVISSKHIEKDPVVNVGDKIIAIYENGTVVVTFEGVARQNGAEGEIIKIRAMDTQYSARVVNSNQVNIIE